MGATWLIATKELRQRSRDRSLFVLAFVAPLALSFIFSVVFGGLDEGDRIQFDIGVVDLDGGEQSDGFLGMLGQVAAEGLITVTAYDDTGTARDAVDDTDIDAAIVLPKGLSDAFATGTPVEIQVIGSVDSPIATSVASSLARGYATRSGTAALAGITAAGTGVVGPDQIVDVANDVGNSEPLASLTTVETDTPQVDLTTLMVSGMSVFFVFFVAGTAVTGVLEERQNGTLPRLLASPAPRASIILGKATAAIITGVVALVALMVTSTLVMGADWGNPFGAVLLATAAVLAATGIMSMVGGVARSAEQAGNLQAIVAVSMAMLGGSFGLAPPPGGTLWASLALLTPNRWFMRGVEDLSVGGLGDIVTPVVALIIMAIVTGSVAAAAAGRVVRA